AARALLRAHHRLSRSGAVGLAATRHRRLVGRRGGHALMRRLVDIIISALALLLSAPLLLGAMAAIRLESPGRVIYRQRRVGTAAWPSSPVSRAGRRSTAAPPWPGPSASSWTSTT